LRIWRALARQQEHAGKYVSLPCRNYAGSPQRLPSGLSGLVAAFSENKTVGSEMRAFGSAILP